MQIKYVLPFLFLISCSSSVEKKNVPQAKEFSKGEIILASKLLDNIFDKQMAPIECVKDLDEAELLLRTLTPRLEIAQDDVEAQLDDPKEIDTLIESCSADCTCGYIDELMKEHQVELTKKQRKSLSQKASDKELSRCLNYAQTTFCQSDLYKTLNEEKKDFSYEENP
jgi:hypothetical protein